MRRLKLYSVSVFSGEDHKSRNKVAFFHKRNLENGKHGHAFIYRKCPDGMAGVDVYEQSILAMIA